VKPRATTQVIFSRRYMGPLTGPGVRERSPSAGEEKTFKGEKKFPLGLREKLQKKRTIGTEIHRALGVSS